MKRISLKEIKNIVKNNSITDMDLAESLLYKVFNLKTADVLNFTIKDSINKTGAHKVLEMVNKYPDIHFDNLGICADNLAFSDLLKIIDSHIDGIYNYENLPEDYYIGYKLLEEDRQQEIKRRVDRKIDEMRNEAFDIFSDAGFDQDPIIYIKGYDEVLLYLTYITPTMQ